MDSKTQIIQAFLAELSQGIGSTDELFEQLGVIRDQVFTEAYLEDILPYYEQLVDGSLSRVPDHQLGHLSLFLGMGIESGLPPESLGSALIPRARMLLIPLAEALKSALDQQDLPHPEDHLAEHAPELERSWQSVSGTCTALTSIALLGHLMRQTLCEDADLLEALMVLSRFDVAPEWTYDMARMLGHEHITLVHVPSRRGWRATAHGIYNNFQLYAFVTDCLSAYPDARDLVPTPPAPAHVLAYTCHGHGEVGPISSPLNLYEPDALDEDLQIAGPLHHAVWTEGKPWHIPRHQGQVVILLGPAPYHRSWVAGADTNLIESSLTITGSLTRQEVTNLLQAMRDATMGALH